MEGGTTPSLASPPNSAGHLHLGANVLGANALGSNLCAIFLRTDLFNIVVAAFMTMPGTDIPEKEKEKEKKRREEKREREEERERGKERERKRERGRRT